jgi:hypothetical protein
MGQRLLRDLALSLNTLTIRPASQGDPFLGADVRIYLAWT